ncbi:MAG: hypothetical protein PWP23_2905 [Candidatus Sumerlaeota bacterium]|nr:hypothetical protein [Candidatus Sumerlaeota bacterium]
MCLDQKHAEWSYLIHTETEPKALIMGMLEILVMEKLEQRELAAGRLLIAMENFGKTGKEGDAAEQSDGVDEYSCPTTPEDLVDMIKAGGDACWPFYCFLPGSRIL